MREIAPDSSPYEVAQQRIASAASSGADKLNLSGLGLKSLPPEIGQLTQLKELYLCDNQLRSLRPEIGQLTKLRELDLKNNQLSSLPPEIGQLTQLQQLDLGYNELSSLPPEIPQLTQLQALHLNNNHLSNLPPEIRQLTELQMLGISGNQLSTLPPEIGKSIKLKVLGLVANQLSSLPPEIGQLTQLQMLALTDNRLSSLPPEIGQLRRLMILYMSGNTSLRYPPKDIVELGSDATIRYLHAAWPEAQVVWESRVLFVGEGSVGKTWLYEALDGRPAGGDKKDGGATIGIEIGPLFLGHPEQAGVQMRLNCWDFAGQEFNHATHQFFFSDRTLFLLCWNARAGWEAGKLRKWLNNIRDRAPGAKVILVATQCDEPHSDYPEKELRDDFRQIVATIKTSSKTGMGINELLGLIAMHAKELPMMGLRWPPSWWRAASHILTLQEKRSHASLDQVQKKIMSFGLRREDANVLLRWLHELGQILHYPDSEELRNVVMLNPQWVTRLVGKVLASPEVAQNQGIVSQQCLERLWPELDEGMRLHLLGMMDRFDLAYRIPEDHQHRSLVVERLQQNEADYQARWNQFSGQRELRLRFKLKAMHPGIPTWLIARCHRFTLHLHWLRGALFGDDRHQPRHLALVRAYDPDRTLDFTVRGPLPYSFMGLLVDAFLSTVTGRYPGLEMERLVPCPGPSGNGPCGHYFKQVNLEERLKGEKARPYINCEQCNTDHQVIELLLGLSAVDAVQAALLEKMLGEVRAEGEKTREQMEAGFASLREAVQLGFIREWNAQQLLAEQSCPSVFSLYALNDGAAMTSAKLRLQLYCMAPGCWHSVGADGRAECAPLREWAGGVVSFLHSLGTVAKPMATVGAALLPGVGMAVHLTASELESTKKEFEKTGKLLAELKEMPKAELEVEAKLLGDSRAPRAHSAEEMRTLKKFLDGLKFPKRPYGGLVRRRTPEDHVLWLCPAHAKQYDG